MRHLVKMGDSHGAAQLRKTVRKGCGTRDHHRLWFNWDPCGMFCASFCWAVEISSFFGMLVRRRRAPAFAGGRLAARPPASPTPPAVAALHALHPCTGDLVPSPSHAARLQNKVIIPYFGAGFWGLFHATVLGTICLLALTSHARAMLSNPGAVPAHAKPVNPEHWSKHCHRCGARQQQQLKRRRSLPAALLKASTPPPAGCRLSTPRPAPRTAGATTSSRRGRTTAASAGAASSRWTTIAHGSTLASVRARGRAGGRARARRARLPPLLLLAMPPPRSPLVAAAG